MLPTLIDVAPATRAVFPAWQVTAVQASDDDFGTDPLHRRDATLSFLEQAILNSAPNTVLITPETFLVEPLQQQADVRWDALLTRIEERQVNLLLGMPAVGRDEDGMQLLNAVVQLSPGHTSLYAKERLVPGAEYLPWPRLLSTVYASAFHDRVRSQISAPARFVRPLFVAGANVGLSICYELSFAYTVARRLADADVLVNVSDDAWIDSSAFRQHMLTTARLRALEFAKPVIRVAGGGRSVYVDDRGDVVASAIGLDAQLVSFAVTLRTGATHYANIWRGVAALPVTAWLVSMTVFGVMKRRRRPLPHVEDKPT